MGIAVPITRDTFNNTHHRGGEQWYVTLSGEDTGIPAVDEDGYRLRRHPVVADMGDGSYKFAIRPGKRLRKYHLSWGLRYPQ